MRMQRTMGECGVESRHAHEGVTPERASRPPENSGVAGVAPGHSPSMLGLDWSDDLTGLLDGCADTVRMRRRTKLIRELWYGALVCVVFLLVGSNVVEIIAGMVE